MTSKLNPAGAMTGNWEAKAGCDGKIRFNSFEQASGACKDRKKGRNSIRRGVYACPKCKGFHIGRRNGVAHTKDTAKRRMLEAVERSDAKRQQDEARELQQQNAGL